MIDDPLVRIEHVKQAHMCTRGARAWFAHHGLSYQDFLFNGMPASVIEATGDAMGMQVARIARESAAQESEAQP